MIWSVAIDAQGRQVATASQDGTVRLWQIGTGGAAEGGGTESIEAIEPALAGHEGGVNAVAFDGDGARVVSGGDDGTVRVWDVAERRPMELRPMTHDGPVLAVAFSHDGETIASGGIRSVAGAEPPNGGPASRDFCALRLWNARTGEPARPAGFGRRIDRITSLAFSPDDDRIVAGGADGALRQWNIAGDGSKTRRFDARFEGHRGRVTGVLTTPDGRSIVSTGADGTVRLWPGSEAWPELVCAKLTRNLSQLEWRELVSSTDPYECQCPGLPIPADEPGGPAPDQTACATRQDLQIK